jgi:signal transduction histidine kinase
VARFPTRAGLKENAVTLDRLKWLTVIAPLLFLAAIELVRTVIAPDLFRDWPGYLLLAGLVLIGTFFFANAVFRAIDRYQAQIIRQNRELLALHDAGTGILGELDLEAVLQRVVDRARDLVGAKYGALSLVGDDEHISAFLTSGITAEERARMGPLPVGHGLLGVVLAEGKSLRLADLTRHPRSVGFPPNHPRMRSLLAVPVVARQRVLGNLYLTEKLEAPEFDEADEESLRRFATQAALAIESAHLHRQLQALAITEERERIAREMHDSLAQVLGYVNTKAQAAQTLVRKGETERAAEQIGQLAEAARGAYADVREGILGLRTSRPGERGFHAALADYLQQWQGQSGIAVELVAAPDVPPRLAPAAEVQLLRIVQEALTNVRKHAGAERATVGLETAGDTLIVTIADDGGGFALTAPPPSAGPRFGLATMRERAEAIGGTFTIESTAGQGTRVTVRVPQAGTPGGPPDAGTHR